MHVKQFGQNFAGHLRRVVQTGTPLPVTKYSSDYVHVVPTELWREAEQALAEKRAREQSGETVSV